MRQTLFYIPHAFLDGPLLYLWIALGIVIVGWTVYRKGFTSDLLNVAAIFIVGGIVIKFVVPELEVPDVDPENPDGDLIKAGIAIRGYGFMMLLGIVAGGALAVIRGMQMGIQPERIVSLVIYMIFGGVVGARAFFVFQYPENFSAIKDVVDMTKGGLVVYGSAVGALLVTSVFAMVNKLSVWKLADIVAPAMMLGLALGRIGCLLNGCCFGGPCPIEQIGVGFPAGSAPYLRQLETGELLGLKTVEDDRGRLVEEVAPGSLGEELGIQSGETIKSVHWPEDQYMRVIKEKNVQITSRERSTVQFTVGRRTGSMIPIFRFRRVVEGDMSKLATTGPLELLGIEGEHFELEGLDRINVLSLKPSSLAREMKIQPGDVIDWPDDEWKNTTTGKIYQITTIMIHKFSPRSLVVPISELPSRSVKIHPTQIYSAINAALLCAFLWFYYPYRKRNGELIAVLLVVYPITRFLLEEIRTDEPGQFGTPFTISQLFSLAVIVVGIGLIAWFRRPTKEEQVEAA